MKKIILLIIGAVLITVTPVWAAWIQGEVLDVDERTNRVTIQASREHFPDPMDVKILRNAKYKNFTNLRELEPGSKIKLDARDNQEQGFWDANYIELIEAKETMQ